MRAGKLAPLRAPDLRRGGHRHHQGFAATLPLSEALSAAVTAAVQEYVPLARQANVQALRSLPIGPIGREAAADPISKSSVDDE